MNIGTLPRLLRAQFTPIMIAPVVLGTAVAWHAAGAFTPSYFVLVLVGAVCLHLAANGIDDVYDYLNGTDKISERMFPQDSPGWKPIPRGVVSVGDAVRVSYLLYGVSVAIGILLSVLVGWYALLIAVPGILLSYFYTAPPLRLDYRGLGLGETSIFLSFGPIPALGAFYVMAGSVSVLPLLAAIPSGLLTTAILISHDLIYFDVYRQSGKRSITVVVGKRAAVVLATSLSVFAYAVLALLVAEGVVPVFGLLAAGAIPLLLRFADLRGRELSPPEYGARTTFAFLHSVLFSALLAAGFVLA